MTEYVILEVGSVYIMSENVYRFEKDDVLTLMSVTISKSFKGKNKYYLFKWFKDEKIVGTRIPNKDVVNYQSYFKKLC